MYKQVKDLRNVLVVVIFTILIFGLLMVYDASNVWSLYKYNDAFYYIKRQSIFALVGIVIFFLLGKIKLRLLSKYSGAILIVSIVLLVLVLIPGLGQVRNGSRSWFGIGALGFQPSELFKVALIIFGADFLSKRYEKTTKFISVLPFLLISILGFVLIMLEPDFGTGLVILAGVAMLLFVSKLRARYYVMIGALAIGFFVFLIVSEPYRFDRITSFIDPYSDPLGTGFQMIQSLFAIGPGGLTGFGYLNSLQQHYYLPEPQTDFIFAIVVSNFGLVGSVIVLVLYGYLFNMSYKLASTSEDSFIAYLKIGLTNSIVIQSLINLGVVVGLLPVTGITLPLFSYGGSSLVITLASLGLVVNIKEEKDEVLALSK